MMHSHINTPSPELFKAFRAALMLRGSSLSRWSQERGVKRQNLSACLLGRQLGPKAAEWVRRALEVIAEEGLR